MHLQVEGAIQSPLATLLVAAVANSWPPLIRAGRRIRTEQLARDKTGDETLPKNHFAAGVRPCELRIIRSAGHASASVSRRSTGNPSTTDDSVTQAGKACSIFLTIVPTNDLPYLCASDSAVSLA